MVGWLKFNIIEKIPFMVYLEIQCITFKMEKSFIAHPWIQRSVVGLEEYSAHDWRAATSGTARPSYLARVGPVISTTDAISYLGVMFSSSGSFTQAQCKLAEQANKAVFLLYRRINRFRKMKISEILGLFDKIVLPILLYGCEVWGFTGPRKLREYIWNSVNAYYM